MGGIYKTKIVNGLEVTLTADEVAEREAEAAACATSLPEVKTVKQSEIRDKAESALSGLKVEYCETEIATWDQQYDEAKAYTADSSSSVPLLTAIATARGQEVAALVAKVMSNRATWVAISGGVVGQRLAYQDKLDAATTVGEVLAIEVSYSVGVEA